MITISRLLAKHLASVIPRALSLPRSLAGNHPVRLGTGPDGLCVRSATPSAATEYREATPLPPADLVAPLELFRAVASGKSSPVTIAPADDGTVIARWQDGQIPRAAQWSIPDTDRIIPFPPLPESFVENPPELRSALDQAFETTDSGSIRLALGCIQLRGQDGSIAATDRHQVLLQRGFQFGFEGDLLVERTTVFGYAGLPENLPVHFGRNDQSAVFRLGGWTFWLPTNKEGRFPRVEHVIPLATSANTTLEIHRADREFLSANLPKLPSADGATVTVDLNGSIAIRSLGEPGSQPTELVLSSSHCEGNDVCLSTDRRYLQRAVEMGFDRLSIYGPEAPVCCQDDRRAYVWAVLNKDNVVLPQADTVRIASPPGGPSPPLRPKNRRQSTSPVPSTPMTQTSSTTAAAPSVDGPTHRKTKRSSTRASASIIEQATGLRNQLRETLVQTNELIRTLKRQTRQQRLMQSTLKSLKELQAVG